MTEERAVSPTATQVPAKPIIDWSLAILGSNVLFSAHEVGLFTVLAERSALTTGEVAEALDISPRLLPDVLNTLVVMGILERDGDRYGNSPAANQFLNAANPASYLGGFIDFAQKMLSNRVTRLTGALRTGLPQGPNGATTEDLRQLYANPFAVKAFAAMMTAYTMDLNRTLAEVFPWGDYSTVADVSCAQGGLLMQVLLRHPHLSGVGFDLPEMQPAFDEYAAKCQLSDRSRFQPGDFFVDPVPAADVITLGNTLADFDDSARGKILAKVHDALPVGGVVIMYGSDPDKHATDLGDLYKGLLVGLTTAGGGTYSASSGTWLPDAGFKDISEVPISGSTTLITGKRQ
jgi:hypothetical protein